MYLERLMAWWQHPKMLSKYVSKAAFRIVLYLDTKGKFYSFNIFFLVSI